MTTPEPLDIDLQQRDGATVVTPKGTLDLMAYGRLRDTLIKCAMEVPRALVVDVGGLRFPTAATMSVFTTVWMRVSEWPGVPVVLVAEDQSTRRLLADRGIARFVPVHDSVDDALLAANGPPARRRIRLKLPDDESTAAQARYAVEEICERWGRPHQLTQDVVAVVDALVDNVLRHGRGCPSVRLELRGVSVTVAVADDGPAFVPPNLADSQVAYGLGLLLVNGLANAWGCRAAPSGGKVVWAVLRPLEHRG